MKDEAVDLGGKIILLNGASSSGKSSIARAVQGKIDEPFWHISIDHLRDAGVLPLARIRSGEFKWADMRQEFFVGFENSLVAYVNAGNSLIVEYIIEDKEWLKRVARTLDGMDVFFVGIQCPLDVLESREQARGDRPLGDARRDFYTVHDQCAYDLELNSTLLPELNADILIAAWKNRSHPSAFERILTFPYGGT
jgi:chloramphenicol 3-O phosphotransferase